MRFFSKKRWWLILIILVILGLILGQVFKKSSQAYVTAEAVKGDLEQTVEVTGSVRSAEEVNLNFTVAGKVSDIQIKVGDQVKADQILATLVATEAGSQVADARAALDIARSEYDQLLAGASAADIKVTEQELSSARAAYQKSLDELAGLEQTKEQTLTNLKSELTNTINNKVPVAQFALDVIYDSVLDNEADSTLYELDTTLLLSVDNSYFVAVNNFKEAKTLINRAKETDSIDDILVAADALEAVLKQIQASLNNTYTILSNAVPSALYTAAVLSDWKSQVSTQSTNVSTAISALQSDAADLRSNDLSYRNQIIDKKNDIETKLAGLNLAQAKLELKTAKPRDFEIQAAQAKIRRAQATVDRYIGELNKTTIRAPFDGLITEINYEKGEQTSLAEAAIVMIGLRDQEIEVDVPESDITKISNGDQVDIRMDAFSSGQKFPGQVAFIDPAATTIDGVIYYQVKINFSEEDERIKSGMTADITIRTDSRQDVLIVPSRAVIYREDKKYVQLLVDGQLVEREVQAGLRGDDGLVEILSGIEVGDQVITYINSGK